MDTRYLEIIKAPVITEKSANMAQNEGKYMMGILLDDKIYHAIPTMSDREIVQPSVLKALDWRIKRIWTLDWFERPEHVLENILDEVKRA